MQDIRDVLLASIGPEFQADLQRHFSQTIENDTWTTEMAESLLSSVLSEKIRSLSLETSDPLAQYSFTLLQAQAYEQIPWLAQYYKTKLGLTLPDFLRKKLGEFTSAIHCKCDIENLDFSYPEDEKHLYVDLFFPDLTNFETAKGPVLAYIHDLEEKYGVVIDVYYHITAEAS